MLLYAGAGVAHCLHAALAVLCTVSDCSMVTLNNEKENSEVSENLLNSVTQQKAVQSCKCCASGHHNHLHWICLFKWDKRDVIYLDNLSTTFWILYRWHKPLNDRTLQTEKMHLLLSLPLGSCCFYNLSFLTWLQHCARCRYCACLAHPLNQTEMFRAETSQTFAQVFFF